jgi:hypothetical protein
MESGVSEFLRQLPAGFIVMFCGSGILLLIALVYIFRARTQRVQAAAPESDEQPAPAPMSEADLSDLPELDVLASVEMPKAAPPRPAGAQSVTLTGGGSIEAVEVLTILRDVADGGLIIRIGEQAHRNPPAVADAEFKRRFHNALRDLNSAQQPVGVPRSAPPPVSVEAAEADSEAEPDSVSEPSEMPPLDDLPSPAAPPTRRTQTFEPAPGDLPKFRMPDAPVRPKRGQRPVNEPIPEIDIAGSIEAYLQHKLAQHDDYDNRSIHVRSSGHGVRIEVDGRFFDSVGEVDDAEVRQFLSATIEEWQARQ